MTTTVAVDDVMKRWRVGGNGGQTSGGSTSGCWAEPLGPGEQEQS